MAKARQLNIGDAVQLSALMVGFLFVVKAAEVLFQHPLSSLGIVPRTRSGLLGILFSPVLHLNWNHLLANAIPLFVLLILLLTDRHYHPYRTLALIWFASGLGTWLIGRGHSVHLGASSIIFGLIVYLIVAGLTIGSWRSVLVALVVFFLFGGVLYGILPHAGPISWEGHLCGAIAGAWAARENR
jgi:membrane associated rhomboid family serine protease